MARSVAIGITPFEKDTYGKNVLHDNRSTFFRPLVTQLLLLLQLRTTNAATITSTTAHHGRKKVNAF